MTDFPYATTYDPPAPACDVGLISGPTGRRVELSAIIDSGADGTIIPVRYLREIGARRTFEAGLRSQWAKGGRSFSTS